MYAGEGQRIALALKGGRDKQIRLYEAGPLMAEKMTDAENNLNPRQFAFVEALADGATRAEAIQKAGISERTARRYLNLPEVQAALHTAQDEALRALGQRLTSASDKALDLLIEVVGSKKVNIHARIRAAGIILAQRQKFMELVDLAARVAILEARLSEETN